MWDNKGTYLIAIFNEYFDFLVIKIAHADTLDLVIHLSVYPGATRTHEYAKVHHHICGALLNLRTFCHLTFS